MRPLIRLLLRAAPACAGLAVLAGGINAQTIVAFGDSTTAPRGKTEVYATLLQKELSFEGKDVRVINAGVPGNTTGMAKARFATDVLERKPQVVIVQFGINDSAVDVWKKPPATKPRVALADYEKNLRGFVTTLKERSVRVVLMTPNMMCWTDTLKKLYSSAPYRPEEADGMNPLLRDYVEAVRRIAREEDVSLVDVFAAYEEQGRKPGFSMTKKLLPDGMHPNDNGHRMVTDLLMDHLMGADHRFARKPSAGVAGEKKLSP